mgnify:CR=1 FL=1
MFWIYVIKCENGMYYVGLTQHLYKRLAKHSTGEACKNTRVNKPLEIIGIYKGATNFKFNKYLSEYYSTHSFHDDNLMNILKNFDYDSNILQTDIECVENYITEHMQISLGYQNVRGGRYLRGEEAVIKDNTVHEARPSCHCGIPCEVQKRIHNKKVKFIFVCPLRNVWDSMRSDFKRICIAKQCSFYKEYLDDIEFRIGYTEISN